MTCDEGQLLAFLDGALSNEDERAFDEHLLTCESCWQAVRQDRVGRLALERLREPAPPGLRDRVALSIDLAGEQPGRSSARRGRFEAPHRGGRGTFHRAGRLVVAVALLVMLFAGGLGWLASQDHQGSDPAQIAKVVAMMSPKVSGDAVLRDGEHFVFGGQSLTVRSYRIEGIITLVATSPRPFPMPESSHLLAGSSPTAWMATTGSIALYGVNRPFGAARESMFIVSAMPMAELPQVAARLHLI